MKFKKLYVLIVLTFFCFIPLSALAAGSISVSTSNINLKKGESASFTITANNAAGRIDISSSNEEIAKVSASSIFLDMQRETITVTANSIGTASIKVYVTDATTYDDENLSGKTYTINVTVTEKTTNNIVNSLSKNNNLKSIEAEGYELIKVDNNNYTLTVNNDINKLKINATAEDIKAKISGIGEHQLNIGENNIEIVITSESGLQNKINVKIIRKDGYYLEDLEDLLLNPEFKEVRINIEKDSIISSDHLNKIKDSGKEIKLNYFDENKKMIYSWSFEGKKIEKINAISTSILYTSAYIKEISELSNYADGLYITYKHTGELPKETKTKLYVGDKFNNNSNVKAYCYDSNKKKLNLYLEELKVNEGYVEFNVNDCSNYFLSMADIYKTSEESGIAKKLVIFLLIELVIVNSVAIYLVKIKHTK